MRFRTPAVLLLSALIAGICSLSFVIGQAPKDPPKDPPKDMGKEPPKDPTKQPEYKWPKAIGGKGMGDWLNELNDPDPAMREAALRTLPAFGPDAQKAAGKLLVERLKVEQDSGVRLAVFNTIASLGFDEKDKASEKEALRILAEKVDTSGPGSATRYQALVALGAFGPKAYPYIVRVVGQALNDTSYETRRTIATTLGRIAFHELSGPSQRALVALSGTLSKDVCVAVRMEALQSLVLLGPSWSAVRKTKDDPTPPPNQAEADVVADHMRHRLGLDKGKAAPAGALEPDKQLEIWCRVVLLRFDPKEITKANLDQISKHIKAAELGPKLQAIQALAIFGERADNQIDTVVLALDDDDPLVLNTTLTCLARMGIKAVGAIPELEKMEAKWKKKQQEQMARNLQDKQFTDIFNRLEQKEKDQVIANMPNEQCRLGIVETIKWIKNSKEGKPGGDMATAPDPKDPKVPKDPKKP